MTASNNTLNFLNVNVCGLESKLNVPKFNELIQSFDIVTYTETKRDELDVIRVNNYICIQKNQKQKYINILSILERMWVCSLV